MATSALQTPLGPLTLTEEAGFITRLDWGADGADDPSALTIEAAAQLSAYFSRRLTRFDLPLAFGSGLHERVRRAMVAIPLGEVRTYGELARALNAPAQAIGQACGANPIPILIPCHRVVAAQSLGGFSARGGVETKVWLLKHEGAASLLI